MYLENQFGVAPEVPKEVISAFLKERRNYKVWKSCDITWYYTTADIKEMFKADNQSLANRFGVGISRMSMWTLMRIVQHGDYLYGLNRKREVIKFVLKVCDICHWIEPHFHSPECSIGIVENIMVP